MTVAHTLTTRNAAFAAGGHFHPELRMMPTLRTIVIACVDPRVDPVHVLGLEQGETAVIRNVGGRVTADTLTQLALLRGVTQAAGGDLAAGWEIVVLQHTDCGITRLADHAELPTYLGGTFDQLAVADPSAAVALDLAALLDETRLGEGVVMSGLVYDVTTGLVTPVTPVQAGD